MRTQTPRLISIGDRTLGEGHPVFIIAEIGYNFRSLEEAKESIEAAKACGADAVKFQTFRAETLVAKGAHFPKEAGSSNQYEEFKQYEMSETMHKTLFEHAQKEGILPLSTPSYFDDADLLERLKVPLFKIGSDDLTNLPFIHYVAHKKKPMIMSTGMATMSEIDDAVQTVLSAGNPDLILLQCVSNYPIMDFRLVNLRALETFRQSFPCLVGLSDHTTSPAAALGAVALGACMIERHFTLDKAMPVPDAAFSADPTEMRQLVRWIREVEQSLGDGHKRPAPSESQMRLETRKSLIAREDIASGEIITEKKVIIKRPATGVLPKFKDLVMGRQAKQAIASDEVITWDKLG